ncbi:TRAP transporter large permease [Desertibaculum subflavum]|uniref:TRAP transporter large permease n=1 Tax=Desertibaculum subflavum TaxID=2268458 RepID=UPI000E660BBA
MTIAIIGFVFLLVLAFIGFPLGFTTLAVGLVGFAYARDWNWHASLTMMSQQVVETGGSYGLSVIPLFILMGVFIHRANISEDLYRASYALVGRYRGGLAQATVLACAGFSAVSGSSLATAATMTKVAMPHMRRYRYDDALSSGVVSAGGTLGIMIPPSVPMVIYGLVAQEDIGKLFIAGVMPGILLTLLFMAAVWFTVQLNPAAGPAGTRMPAVERWRAYANVWPVVMLFVLILGGIYLGAFTPTEASGIGATGAALFAFWRGRLRTIAELYGALIEACRTTATLFMAIFGAQVFANFINLSGLPGELINIVEAMQLSAGGVVIAVCVICIILGMIFESVGLLLLIVPVFLPTLMALDVDLIWFGIIMIVVVEMGLITPPIGMNVFTVKTVMPDIALPRIFRGVMPFVVADFVALGLIFFFPLIAMWLVSHL